jgi:hypothetical protein
MTAFMYFIGSTWPGNRSTLATVSQILAGLDRTPDDLGFYARQMCRKLTDA